MTSPREQINKVLDSVKDPTKTGFVLLTINGEEDGVRIGIHHNIGSKLLLITLLEENLRHVKSDAYQPTKNLRTDIRPESST